MRRLTLKSGSARMLCFMAGLIGIAGSLCPAPSADAAPEPAAVEVHGRLICIPELMQERYGADLPTDHEHILGFRTGNDRVFTLLRTKLSEALFADPALREKELLLKGKIYPGTQILDVTLMRSVKDGRVYDLYYWCDICAIKSVVPGTCMCCQEDVVLKEIPLEEALGEKTKHQDPSFK
jgi:hypothetical protein